MSTYSNPMEWVGEAHNAGVKWIISNFTLDPKMTREQAHTKIEKLATQYFDVVGFAMRDRFPLESNADAKSVIEVLEKKGAITAKGTQAVSKLLATIQREQPLKTLLTEIEQQEHAAAGNLLNDDLLFFQSLAAIGRHSAKLWSPVDQGGEGFPHSVIPTVMAPNPPQPTVLQDLFGYLCGGLGRAVRDSLRTVY